MRLGIVGFGRLAQNYYVPALARMTDVARVDAIADPNAGCRAAAGDCLPRAATFGSLPEMLANAALDGILIATPPAAHLDALHDLAAHHALAVFMEKPLASPGQLELVRRLPLEIHSRLMLNFNRRFWHRYQQIANAVQSGRIGALQSGELELQVDVTQWLSVTQHRIEKGHGGALFDLGSQMIDLAGFIVGQRPIQLSAEAQSKRWEADHVTIYLTFPDRNAVICCRVAYDAPTRERIILRGTKGAVRIDNPNMAVHFSERRGVVERLHDFATLARHAATRHTSMSRMTIELALRAFAAQWQKKQPMVPGFAEGLFNAAALEAANRSVQSGECESIDAVRTEAIA
jgi:predicted dehydrogenase